MTLKLIACFLAAYSAGFLQIAWSDANDANYMRRQANANGTAGVSETTRRALSSFLDHPFVPMQRRDISDSVPRDSHDHREDSSEWGTTHPRLDDMQEEEQTSARYLTTHNENGSKSGIHLRSHDYGNWKYPNVKAGSRKRSKGSAKSKSKSMLKGNGKDKSKSKGKEKGKGKSTSTRKGKSSKGKGKGKGEGKGKGRGKCKSKKGVGQPDVHLGFHSEDCFSMSLSYPHRPIDEEEAESLAVSYMTHTIGGGPYNVFVPAQVNFDSHDQIHVRVDRFYKGLLVLGGETVVHMDAFGKLRIITGTFLDVIDIPIRVAQRPEHPEVYSVVYVGGKIPRQAHVTSSTVIAQDGTPEEIRKVIDSKSGALLTQWSDTPTVMATTLPVGDNIPSNSRHRLLLGPESRSYHEAGGLSTSNRVQHLRTAKQQGTSQNATQHSLEVPTATTQNVWMTGRRTEFVWYANAQGKGRTLYSGTVDISILEDKLFPKYLLVDGTRLIEVRDYNDTAVETGSKNNRTTDYSFDSKATLFTSNSRIFGNSMDNRVQPPPRDRATVAADAAYGAQLAFDYFKNVHGRKGVWNYNTETLTTLFVHIAAEDAEKKTIVPYCNAFFTSTTNHFYFGDCDKTTANPYVAVETVAHEWTHGVMRAIGKKREDKFPGDYGYGKIPIGDQILSYNHDESGALNEATADIFGTMVEFYAAKNNSNVIPNWLIGEKVHGSVSKPLKNYSRSMIQPSSDDMSLDCYCAKSFTGDKGYGKEGGRDPHYSSGIANHFFYLLSEGSSNSPTCVPVVDCKNAGPAGKSDRKTLLATVVRANGNGTVIGIGKERAAKIWYRALNNYFVPNTNFSNARDWTVLAAKDLKEDASAIRSIECAWAAVLVGPKPVGGCGEPTPRCPPCPPSTICVEGKCVRRGNPRFTLTWTGDDDLDLYVQPPCGAEISFKNTNPGDISGGALDTDSNFGVGRNGRWLENVYFPLTGTAPPGKYHFWMQVYSRRGVGYDSWKLQVFEGDALVEEYTGTAVDKSTVFTYNRPPAPGQNHCPHSV